MFLLPIFRDIFCHLVPKSFKQNSNTSIHFLNNFQKPKTAIEN